MKGRQLTPFRLNALTRQVNHARAKGIAHGHSRGP